MANVPGKSYVVGGAVRDRLLGLPVSDRDHVVVGATVEEMKAAGFKPVGRDFPVFLHPESHEEYALARTERKVAPGYAGFVFHADPSVSLEADLERRDLTINAMAEDDAGSGIVDPFGGRRDLDARVFRHVGPAFVEDPVRILRVARFAARFPDFGVAPGTMALMRSMVRDGEVDALVPERVWREFSRGLMERHPIRMLDLLGDVGALARLLPEFTTLPEVRRRQATDALESAASEAASLEIRFAVLFRVVDGIEPVCARFGVPRALRDLALLVARESEPLRTVAMAASSAQVGERLTGILARSDAFRRRKRFHEAIRAIGLTIADRTERTVFETRVAGALDAATAIDAGTIARAAGPEPASIARALHDARRASLERTW